MSDESFYQNQYQRASFGRNGAKKLVPADPVTTAGVIYVALQAREDSAVTATEHPPEGSVGDTSYADTILAGTVEFGRFSEIDLTSGNIRAYLEE